MIAIKRFLTAASLAILFLTPGCTTVASHNGGAEGGKNTDRRKELIGKVVRTTPCRTLVEIEAAKAGESSETTKMQFFCLDPEARKSARGVKKGDTARVQYDFSPETQRNRLRKIAKVTGESEIASAPATAAPNKVTTKRGVARGTVIAASSTELKLKTDPGQEATFGVRKNMSEQVEALKKGDSAEVSYAICPGGCCPNPIVTSVKKL